MATPKKITLETPLAEFRGVGSERAAQLSRLKLHTLHDLILHRPRRYEDRRHFLPIAEMQLGEATTTHGTIVETGVKRFGRSRRSVFEFVLEDGTGRLRCRWWNAAYMKNYFKEGDEVAVFGKPANLKPRTMDHPETEIIEEGDEASVHLNRIVPVYPLTEGLSLRWLRGFIWNNIDDAVALIDEPYPQLDLIGLPSRATAIRDLHFPETEAQQAGSRARLAMDEFLELQLEIQRRRRRLQANSKALPCSGDNRLVKPFLGALDYSLTNAQTRVLRELRADLGGEFPMRRLLQGDVGSGKTVVAAACALMVLESGCNAALMAPTEILAEQHFDTFTKWLEPLGIEIHLRTGTHKTEDDRDQSALLFAEPSKSSGLRITIGTHALIEDSVELEKLGLVLIDEQHKFGVTQREKLLRKGVYPHLLVMTATPIPRTLGLTLYGDLDSSVIDEMPAGRGEIKTYVRPIDRLPKVWKFIRDQVAAGRQAYIVYPRVSETENTTIKAVTKEFKKLQAELAPFKLGLLHGRLKSDEKDGVMEAFRQNEINVLVATSVIEVGVDVPNATIMVIENADQFGLAQLHQLRGRIGRGSHNSYCILIAEQKTEESRQRLAVMEQTIDGFQIAEADMALRGPGEFLGKDQSGLPPFKFGNLQADRDLIEHSREIAAKIIRDENT